MSDLSAKITITAIDRASSVVKSIGGSIERLKAQSLGLTAAWNNVSSASSKVARNLFIVGAAAAGAGASVYAMTKHYAEASEQLQLSATKAGISTQSLQKLQYSAKLANVEAAKLDVSLRFLNKNMAQSLITGSKGKQNEQAQAFKELGINVKDTNGKMKTADQVILEMADKFHTMNNASEKARLATKLLGRAGSDLIPILSQGSEALKKQGNELARLGHILSDKEIQDNKRFAEDLKKLNFAISGLGAVIASALIPVLTPLVENMTNWIAANKEWLGTEIKDDVIAFGKALKFVWEVLKDIKVVIWPVISMLGGLKTVMLSIAAIYLTKTILSIIELGRAVYGLGIAFFLLDLAIAPIIGIVAGFVLIGYAIYELIKHFDEFKAAWLSLWSKLPQTVKDVIRVIAAILTLGISEIVIALYNNWGNIGNSFKTGIKNAFSGMPSFFKLFIDMILGSFSPLLYVLDAVVNGIVSIKNAASGGVSGAVNIKSNVPNGIMTNQSYLPQTTPVSFSSSDNSRYSSMTSPNQKLEVYMKIDAQGRPSQVSAKTDSNTTFHANTGVMA